MNSNTSQIKWISKKWARCYGIPYAAIIPLEDYIPSDRIGDFAYFDMSKHWDSVEFVVDRPQLSLLIESYPLFIIRHFKCYFFYTDPFLMPYINSQFGKKIITETHELLQGIKYDSRRSHQEGICLS